MTGQRHEAKPRGRPRGQSSENGVLEGQVQSEEDQAFVVEVPGLSGCMADGATYVEVVINAQRIIEEWIDTAKELGRPIPAPCGRLMYA
jgi:predicted RNase H-like HicB family nuclease